VSRLAALTDGIDASSPPQAEQVRRLPRLLGS
jgi:hypothetical protein